MTRRDRIPVWLAFALLFGFVLTACTEAPESPADLERHARTAVDRYLAAVSGGDLEAATAMTDPRALVVPEDRRNPRIDVTSALPQAKEKLRDPWVSALGQDDVTFSSPAGKDVRESVKAYRFAVTFRVGPGTGVDGVAVAQMGEDPAAAESWIVVDGLLVTGPVHTVTEHLPAFLVGGVRIANAKPYTPVWGYPGVYLAEGTELPQGYAAEPIAVHLGVEIAPPWNDSLLQLEAHPTETDGG